MWTKAKILIAAGAAIVVAGTAATVSVATSSQHQSLKGLELQRATEAALEYTGEGHVVESESGEGEGAYEVAVLMDDGSVVEVHLDDRFDVTGTEVDGESGGSEQESGASEQDETEPDDGS